MNTLKIRTREHHYNDVFMTVQRSSPRNCVKDKIMLVDFDSNQLVSVKHIVSLETVKVWQLTQFHAYMDKQCSLSIYRKILKDVMNLDENSDVDILVLAEKYNIEALNDDEIDYSIKKNKKPKSIFKIYSKNVKNAVDSIHFIDVFKSPKPTK